MQWIAILQQTNTRTHTSHSTEFNTNTMNRKLAKIVIPFTIIIGIRHFLLFFAFLRFSSLFSSAFLFFPFSLLFFCHFQTEMKKWRNDYSQQFSRPNVYKWIKPFYLFIPYVRFIYFFFRTNLLCIWLGFYLCTTIRKLINKGPLLTSAVRIKI